MLLALSASVHAVLNKRDVRATIGWVGIVWLAPIIGAVLYLLLGVNRIHRRAQALRGEVERFRTLPSVRALDAAGAVEEASTRLGHLASLALLTDRVTNRPLLPGNRVNVLVDGDEAYDAMLPAIRAAEVSVTLATYIFDNDPTGLEFVKALADAHRRGVEVRVLVDGAGAHYSRFPADRLLKQRGVPTARFLPAWLPWRMPFINLRNHRKILVVDGLLGFTGGINIRHGHRISRQPKHPTRDLHFRVEGPVTAHLQEVFAEDWAFTTGERLGGERFFPELEPAGQSICRGIADGPDEDFETMRWTFFGALACARRSVKILTPYFLPDPGLISALDVAALRGVSVSIVVPERTNIRLVDWAMWGQLGQLLQYHCRVFATPPPFDHSKLIVVDEAWVLLGSANWDPRSLRLNFEFNLECHDPELGAAMAGLIDDRSARGREITLEEVEARPLPRRLRDGVARLLSPYL